MSKKSHVLVTTDFSDGASCAFKHANDFVKSRGTNNAKCTVLTVLEEISPGSQLQLGATVIESHGITDELVVEAEEKLKEVKDKYFPDLDVDLVVIKAKKKPVHTRIREWAERNEVDRVLIATHGRSGISHAILGSVTEKIIRESSVPVLVVPVPKGEDKSD
jgi:nucleotide-binding universal stress UspA family protein